MKALVTGAAGFVGINLVRRFAAGGADVVGLVRRPVDEASEAFVASGPGSVRWALGDVTDRGRMRELCADERFDVVVHAAAVTYTEAQERANPATVFDVNAGGTLNLLEACREATVPRLVYVSTGGLYGPAPPRPALDERTPLQTNNLYGVAKVASEHLLLRYVALGLLDGRIGRLGTAYGPMERTTGSRSRMSAVYQAVAAALEERSTALVVDGADVARDFCHVDDVAEAYWLLATREGIGDERVFNVGAPVAAPLRVALDELTVALPGFAWRPATPDDAPEVVQTASNARSGMDLARMARATGWSPRYDLASGVRAYVRWLQADPSNTLLAP